MGKKKGPPTGREATISASTKKVRKESPPERSAPKVAAPSQRPVAAPVPPTDSVRPPLIVRPGLPNKPPLPLLRPLGMPGAPPLPLNMMGLSRPSGPPVPAVLPPNTVRANGPPAEKKEEAILPGMPTTPVRGKATTPAKAPVTAAPNMPLPPAGMPMPQPPRGVPKNVRVPPQPMTTPPAGMPQPVLPTHGVPKSAERSRSPRGMEKNGTEKDRQSEVSRFTEKRTVPDPEPKLSDQLASIEATIAEKDDQIRQLKEVAEKRPRSRSPRRNAPMVSAEPTSGPVIVKQAVGQVANVPFILAEVPSNEKLKWTEDLISMEERRALKLGIQVGL